MTAISGRNLIGSWLNYGPLGSLEKMLLGTSAWASMTCFLTWRDKVTPAGRLLFQLAPQTYRTDGTEFGLWPTATTSPGRPCEGNVRLLRAKVLAGDMSEAEAARMLNGKSPMEAQGKIPALWPTPRTCSAMASNITECRAQDKFPNLEREVARSMWPTPSASDNRDRGNLSIPSVQRRQKLGKQLNLSMVVSHESGALNPAWVEWMMDFPQGWTNLETE